MNSNMEAHWMVAKLEHQVRLKAAQSRQVEIEAMIQAAKAQRWRYLRCWIGQQMIALGYWLGDFPVKAQLKPCQEC